LEFDDAAEPRRANVASATAAKMHSTAAARRRCESRLDIEKRRQA
jgi:hypothetical protein